jgi:hypothetical protein
MKLINKKKLTFSILGFVTLVGVYNAVVINSHSQVAEGKFLKRLDEMTGETIQGRSTASVKWHKLDNPSVVKTRIESPKRLPRLQNIPEPVETPVQQEEKVSAIQEDVKMNLVEVVNPTKYKQGVPSSQFSGNISVSNGVIDSLNVALPNAEGFSIAFSELTGNVFEYDYADGKYSAMMYQVDANSYMVTLSNGPLEGTRLRFAGELSVEQQDTEQKLAENHQVEIGAFGNQSEAPEVAQMQEANEIPTPEVMQAQSVNLETEQFLQ